jgi:hypothetical protein
MRLDNRPLALARLTTEFDALTSGLLQVNFVAGASVGAAEPVVPEAVFGTILERFTVAAEQRNRDFTLRETRAESPSRLASVQSVVQVGHSQSGVPRILKGYSGYSGYSSFRPAASQACSRGYVQAAAESSNLGEVKLLKELRWLSNYLVLPPYFSRVIVGTTSLWNLFCGFKSVPPPVHELRVAGVEHSARRSACPDL